MVLIFDTGDTHPRSLRIEAAPAEMHKAYWPEVRRSYFFRTRQHYLDFMRSCGGRIYHLQAPGYSIPPFVLVSNWRSRSDITALWHLNGLGNVRRILVREAVERSFEEGAALFVTRPLGAREAEECGAWGFAPLYRIVLMERRPQRVMGRSAARGEAEIVRFRKRYLEDVLELDAAAFDHFWRLDEPTLNTVASSCARNVFLLAREGEILTGYAIGGTNGRFGYLQRLGVRQGRQGEGIGEALSWRLLDSLVSMGAGTISVNTQEENYAARALYRKLGFEETPDRRFIMSCSPESTGWGR